MVSIIQNIRFPKRCEYSKKFNFLNLSTAYNERGEEVNKELKMAEFHCCRDGAIFLNVSARFHPLSLIKTLLSAWAAMKPPGFLKACS